MELASFPKHCGTKIVSDFWSPHLPERYSSFVKTLIGIFIDAPDQHRSYKKMCRHYKILYQSPILTRGPGAGRDYFIVIWLNEKP